jgi:N-6 DNA Methylase
MQRRKLKEMEGPMPRGDQLSRQWRLIQLIDRAQSITVDDAARDLAVAMRTVWGAYDPCCGSGGMFVQSEKPIKDRTGLGSTLT